MLEKLPSVTLAQIKEAIKKYFLPLFDPKTSFGAVASNAGKADAVEEGFKSVGYVVERKELPSLGEGEEEGSEEGSEDESEGEDK